MKKYPHLIFLIICIQLLILSLTTFTAWPEMTFWPYLMLKGWLPYENIAIAHTPLLFTTLATWYKAAGIGLIQLKIFTWAAIVTTTALVFFAAGGDKKQKLSALAAAIFGVLNFVYEGNGLWFDLLLMPLAILLYVSTTKKHYFTSGIIFALMIATKQTAIWFAPVYAYTLFYQKNHLQAVKKSTIGFVASILLFILILSLYGIVPQFFNWAIEFGVFTLPRAQGQISLPAIRQIIFALLPFSILVFAKNKRLLVWSIAGALGAFPRFELFHFQPALPFIALAATEVIGNAKFKLVSIAYVAIIAGMFFYTFATVGFQPARFYDKSTINFSSYLDDKTEDDAKVFIINDWDHIYALSNTMPAIDPWVPHLPWYMSDEIQNDIVLDLSNANPEYIAHRPFESKGLGSFRPPILMNYIYSNYKERGTIEGRVILQKR